MTVRSALSSALLVLFALAASAAEPLAKPIEGVWQGTLNAGAQKLRLALRIEMKPGGLAGTLESIDQASGEMPLDSVTFANGTLKVTLNRIGGAFEGKLEGEKLRGTWKQGPAALPLEFTRRHIVPALKRPQEPKQPFPYDEHEVAIKNEDVTLGGTLTMPRKDGPHPAVVLISGSGAQDRDETIFGHRPFLLLADDLTRRGIAVLRVDDRGVGKSSPGKAGATTLDFAGDIAACVAFLKARPDVDAKRIGLVGHSEGGLIAPLVATQTKDVAFMVLIAAPGVPGDELINLQWAALMKVSGATDAQIALLGATQRKIIALAKTTSDESALRAKLRELVGDDPSIEAQIPTLASPWYRQMLNHDPRPVLQKVKVPVLAVNGSKDLQVPAKENLSAIKKALPSATIVELDGLNHLLQTAKTGAVTEYATIEETIAPAALKTIGDWIENVGRASARPDSRTER